MKISEPMQRLRDALDARHIPWEDDTDFFDRGAAGIYAIERTRFKSGTETIGVIYSYTEDSGGRYGNTYGYPDMVEVMPLDDIDYVEPRPMTPEEILDCIIPTN